jgi:hypothetical protein
MSMKSHLNFSSGHPTGRTNKKGDRYFYQPPSYIFIIRLSYCNRGFFFL